jgi:hypothetical protein
LPVCVVIGYVNRIVRTFGLGAGLVFALAGPAAAAPPRDQLRDFQCQRALDPPARAVSVTSVMRPVSHTQAMVVRFELLSRARGAAGYSPVNGSDLGRWIAPADRTLGRRPGDVWIFKKPVVDLPAPAAYRFRVSFRWIGAHRRVLASAVKSSGTCRQPELRSDLLVRHISAPQPNLNRSADFYTVTVLNAGATAAPAFSVQLSDPGHAPATRLIAGLAAYASRTVTLLGGLCKTAAPPIVTVDPDRLVDDLNRKNNVATASCTAATTPF